MEFNYEEIKAGDSKENADTGEDLQRKINNNFLNVKKEFQSINDKIANPVKVIDNLISKESNNALSASQGRILNEKIEVLESKINNENKVDTLKTGVNNCNNSNGDKICCFENIYLANFILYVYELDTENYLIASGIKLKDKNPIITVIASNDTLKLGENDQEGNQKILHAENNDNVIMSCTWNEMLNTL